MNKKRLKPWKTKSDKKNDNVTKGYFQREKVHGFNDGALRANQQNHTN